MPHPARFALVFPLVALLTPPCLHGQVTAVTTKDENFRATPNGVRLASVREGAQLTIREQRDDWRSAVLDGWIWAPSVREEERDGHDLVVSASNGENLRVEPNGAILARLRPGMLLTRVAQQDHWIHVRRRGWIWEPSIRVARATPADPPEPNDPPTPSGTRPARAGTAGGQLLSAPDGDTIAQIQPLTGLEVLASDGRWAHVRLQGWISAPSLAAPTDDVAVDDLATADLAADPDAYRGHVAQWDIQFIALEHAEPIRTDFYEGEPYILARGPADETGFLYVAVPPDLLNDVSRTPPLERIRIRARIRNAWSTLLDAPILDLLAIVAPE